MKAKPNPLPCHSPGMWVKKNAARFHCHVDDVGDYYTQLAIQGPRAADTLQKLTDVDLSTMLRYEGGKNNDHERNPYQEDPEARVAQSSPMILLVQCHSERFRK